MEQFWKATAIVLLSVILGISIEKREKDMSVLLSMAACCAVAAISFTFLHPVLDFLWELKTSIFPQSDAIRILLKAVGIALISELTGLVCADAGNTSLGKIVQMLGNSVILYLSLPLFQTFLSMIREVLGEL